MNTAEEIYNKITTNIKDIEKSFKISFYDNDKLVLIKLNQFKQYKKGKIEWKQVKLISFEKKIIWDIENEIDIFDDLLSKFLKEKEIPKPEILNNSGFQFRNNSWQNSININRSSEKSTFSVVECNVLCDIYQPEKVYSNIRFPKLLHYLNNKGDIIHLQEVTPDFLNMLLNCNWVKENYYVSDLSNTVWDPIGVVTLSKFPIIKVQKIFLNPGKRPIISCKIQINNTNINFINNHLISNRRGKNSKRNSELESLSIAINEIGGNNTIIAGDFNFIEDSEGDQLIEYGLTDVDVLFNSVNTTSTYDPKVNTLARDLNPIARELRMDRVYFKSLDKSIEPTNYFVDKNISFDSNSFLTDHFPIICDFKLLK